jgi:hypothetical protein
MSAMPFTPQTLDQSISLLKQIVKYSCSTDEFRHFDLTLVSADDRHQYQTALKIVGQALRSGQITQSEFEKRVTFKE